MVLGGGESVAVSLRRSGELIREAAKQFAIHAYVIVINCVLVRAPDRRF